MPLREFQCHSCGHITELLLLNRATDEQTIHTACERCQQCAYRVDISRTGAPILVPGIGGFHKPTT